MMEIYFNDKLTRGTTWESVCPLRFVMRDGKRILQHPLRCLETQEVVWQDVPLAEEV